MQVTTMDKELIAYAIKKLKEILVPDKHFVVTALRTQSGKIYTSFNLKTTATRASICAESIALSQAIIANDNNFDSLVTVTFPEDNQILNPIIVSPCGICRELLNDYAPDIKVIIQDNGHQIKLKASALIVFPYRRRVT